MTLLRESLLFTKMLQMVTPARTKKTTRRCKVSRTQMQRVATMTTIAKKRLRRSL